MATKQRRASPVPAFRDVFGDTLPALPGSGSAAVARLRAASIDRFVAAGFPTTRVETWRYTDISGLAEQAMTPAPVTLVPTERLTPWLAAAASTRRLVFVDGHLQSELSNVTDLPAGVVVTSLEQALAARSDEIAALLSGLDDGRALTHLNTAFVAPGAVIEVAAGVDAGAAVQLLFVSTGQNRPTMTNARCLVRLGEGAALRLIETHVGLAAGQDLTNLVLQLDLADRAVLVHDRLQQPGDGMTLLSKLDGRLGAATRYAQTLVVAGGAVVRNESEIRLVGSEAECLMNGLAMPQGTEAVDNMIRMHHVAANCHSDQFYKNVVDGRGHAAFAGKVLVHQEAQKTNAYQKNDSLLLSDNAVVDAKPELEIYADDVKCSHGATCGDIDPTALFYLRSRGIDEAEARNILIHAFAAEIVGRFADATVAALAERAIRARRSVDTGKDGRS